MEQMANSSTYGRTRGRFFEAGAVAADAPESVVFLSLDRNINHLRIQTFLPQIADLEKDAIEQAIKDANQQCEQAIEKKSQSHSELEKSIANIMCCLAYFKLGQQYAKMAQWYFMQNDFKRGRYYYRKARSEYTKILTKYAWEDSLRKIPATSQTQNLIRSTQEAHFNFHFEIVLLNFIHYQNGLHILSETETQSLYDEFFASCESAERINASFADLHFLKTIFLFNFVRTIENLNGAIKAARRFLAHSLDGEQKNLIATIVRMHTVLEDDTNPDMSYETAVPEDASQKIKNSLVNIFFEYVYGQLKNKDLTRFVAGDAPVDSDSSSILIFNNNRMIISIANIYKFMAHFRNITAKFQFTADPKLNAKIIAVLHKENLLDNNGNLIRDNINQQKILLIEMILKPYLPNRGDLTGHNFTFDALLESMIQREDYLQESYDGFSPEMALFLLGKSLQVLPRALCQRANETIPLIDSALTYRDNIRRTQSDAEVEDIITRFIDDLYQKHQSMKMLLITCPVLINLVDNAEYRHSIYILFKKDEGEIKIQIINSGFGLTQFHTADDQTICVREYILENPEESRHVFREYLHILFGLSRISVTTNDAYMENLAHAYHFGAHNFNYNNALIFPKQVTGNCTVFGAQWALRTALSLSEVDHNKLTLDFAKGCDILATDIRTAPQQTIDELLDLIPNNLYEDRIKFPCGYESIARKKFKPPASHHTSEYSPGIAGTNHHIIPQSYLQFLFDKLNSSHSSLLCDVLDKPRRTVITKKQFAYGNFALFHGPSNRSDDPEDSKLDQFGGIETKLPIGFPEARWHALQKIGGLLKQLLTLDLVNFNLQKAKVFAECVTELTNIAGDPTRTIVFAEATPGAVWEIDPTDTSKYQLKQVIPTIGVENTFDEHEILSTPVAYYAYLPFEMLNEFLSSTAEEFSATSSSGYVRK